MYKEISINDFRLFHNQTLLLGKYLTVLSGRNSTGKSTILGMLANSGEQKKKDGVTYSARPFRAEFSELFKGSRQFDEIGADRFTITLCDEMVRKLTIAVSVLLGRPKTLLGEKIRCWLMSRAMHLRQSIVMLNPKS